MKTRQVLFCIVVIMLSSTLVMAQTEKGKIITDMDFNFDSGTTELDDVDFEVDHTQLDTDIEVGTALVDNLELGLFIGVDNKKLDMGAVGKSTENTMYYGLFGRYFFMNGQGLRPFIGAVAGLGTMKMTETGAEDSKHGLTTFSGIFGVAYFINAHVGLELTGKYVITRFKEDDNLPSSLDMSAKAFHIAFGTVVSF